MKKNRLAVCIGVTSDLAFAACVTLKNFVELHGQDGTDFFLFSDGPLPREREALRKIGPDITVLEYQPPLTWLELWKSRAIGYFSPLVLAKFEIFNFLRTHQQVIWLDYDIVIQQPMAELLEADFDIAYYSSEGAIGDQFIRPPSGLDLSKPGMNAGLLSVKESFPDYVGVTSKLYDLYRVHAKNLYMPEQAIFDLYLDAVSPKLFELSDDYCTLPDSSNSTSALVIHSAGPRKFWNSIKNNTWEKNYKELLAVGMPAWNQKKANRKRLLRKIRYLIASAMIPGPFGETAGDRR